MSLRASKVCDTSPWPRIDAWLAKHAPKVLRQLRPPLDPAGIARFEGALGRPLPPLLADAYRAHDGAKGEHPAVFAATRAPNNALWVRSMSWLPSKEAVRRLRWMCDLGIEWNEAWLPVGEDGGGNVLVVDLESGEITVWDHETGEHTSISPDIGTWMTTLADDMEARLVAFDEDSEEEGLELLDAPPVAPVPPVIEPDRPARVLLETLVERRFVALVNGADVAPLVKALGAALASRGRARRQARVLSILEESDIVEEVFADDELIGVLVEEFK